MLAGLCNAAVTVLANTSETGVAPPSRSADIHHWIATAAPALGLTIGEVNSALSADPLIRALTALLQEDGMWTGTATALNAILQNKAVADLPATSKGFHSESLESIWLTS